MRQGTQRELGIKIKDEFRIHDFMRIEMQNHECANHEDRDAKSRMRLRWALEMERSKIAQSRQD